MRNTQLQKVRYMVKAECGKSLDSSSTAQDDEINQLIANTQSELAACYDFPFLKGRWDSVVIPGQRFQVFPTALSPQGGSPQANAVIDQERPLAMMIKWNMIWKEVQYGIAEYPELNFRDSDRGQMLDPIQRWQLSDETKYEVWPLPASNSQCRFIGRRCLAPLSYTPILGAELGGQIGGEGGGVIGQEQKTGWNDQATLDLDDLLVTYFVASHLLTREEKPAAKTLELRAQRRLVALLGAYPTRDDSLVVGGGTNRRADRKAIRQIPMVVIAGQ